MTGARSNKGTGQIASNISFPAAVNMCLNSLITVPTETRVVRRQHSSPDRVNRIRKQSLNIKD